MAPKKSWAPYSWLVASTLPVAPAHHEHMCQRPQLACTLHPTMGKAADAEKASSPQAPEYSASYSTSA